MNTPRSEDVLDLEPVSEVGIDTVSQSSTSIFGNPSVNVLMQTFSANALAMLILDRSYSVVWANDSYLGLFNRGKEIVGSSFFTLCKDPLENEDLGTIYKSLNSKDMKFCWNGRISCRRIGKRTIIAHVQIIPIMSSGGPEPLPCAYSVFMNDITEEYHGIMQNTFMSLLEASILKDKNTGKHVMRVNFYCRFIAETLYDRKIYDGIDIDFIEDLGFLASMHDVGKIGTPDDILNKDGRLEPWEWEIMKEHTINGAYILGTYPNPMAREIALFHHERWDGSGYPYGLAGPMIPLAARIVALADVYDSLRSRRSYKEPFPHEQAYSLIMRERGRHFDPVLIELFQELHSEFRKIYEDHRDSED